MIFASCAMRILRDRELKERTARRLACHQIGHLGVETVSIRQCELDPGGVDPARRPDLAPKELVNSIRRKG